VNEEAYALQVSTSINWTSTLESKGGRCLENIKKNTNTKVEEKKKEAGDDMKFL